MITKQQIESLANEALEGTDLYIVEIAISPASDIEIILDSDTRVNIDQCAQISRAIDTKLEELGEDDYSLMVASSGIGNPLLVSRQFTRCQGSQVEVLLNNGKKIAATLAKYDDQEKAITIAYSEKVAIEGKKRKELVEKEEKFLLSEIKSVREALTIK